MALERRTRLTLAFAQVNKFPGKALVVLPFHAPNATRAPCHPSVACQPPNAACCVLVEKQRTVPDSYLMTLNGPGSAAANQKTSQEPDHGSG